MYVVCSPSLFVPYILFTCDTLSNFVSKASFIVTFVSASSSTLIFVPSINMFLFSSGVILFTVSTFPNSFVEYVVCSPVLFVPYSTFAVVTLSSLLFVKFVTSPSIVSIFVSIPCIVVSTSFLLFVIVLFIVSSCVVKFSVVTLSSSSVFNSLIAFDIVLLVNPLSFESRYTF